VNEKLEQLEQRYQELQAKVADPNILSDMTAYRETMKTLSEIEEVVTKYRELKQVRKSIADAQEMLKGELRELAGPAYPAMAGIGTTALWQPGALIEILGVAVIPDGRLIRSTRT